MKPWVVLCVALLLPLGWSGQTLASGFTVTDIRLQGLQRVSAGTVFNAMQVSVGDRLDQDELRRLIRALYETGYFRDIRVAQDEGALVIILDERPAIDSIEITGNKLIKSEVLLDGLRAQGFTEGEIFKQATLERMTLELERQYIAQGRYGARIETQVEDLPRNQVAISVQVDEGKPSGIRHINIVGNSAFSKDELLGVLELRHPHWFSIIRKDDRYSREKLAGDLERLESFYKDRGYVQFQIDSVQVSITPDLSDVYITINVDEGDIYKVGRVELLGDFKDVNPELLRPLLAVQEGQTFSRALLTFSEERITNALGNAGYTFASASGIPEPREDGLVDVRFYVETGQRTYVRRIEFTGHKVTQDEVLRREMRQMEGGWANTSMIELSKVRLERLGFFQEINVETPEVPGTENQIDVLFSVEEAPSGSISATVGYQQRAGLMLGANYSETNFLGTGNSVDFGIDWMDYRQSINFSYENPYFTLDGISRRISAYYARTDFGRQDLTDYETESFGAGVTFGLPLSEVSRLAFGGEFERVDLQRNPALPPEIFEFIEREGKATMNYKLTSGWSRSTLNRTLFPTRGSQQGVTLDVAVPGGDLSYFKLNLTSQYFYPLTDQYIFRARARVGYGDGYGDTRAMPFYEHYFAGGFGSVRGFRRQSLGPRSTQPVIDAGGVVGPPVLLPIGPAEGSPFGGNLLLTGSLELIFPMPFVQDRRSVRPALFFDAGNVFNTRCAPISVNCHGYAFDEIRYSYGIGLSWLTALGPTHFSYARPLNVGRFDKLERFQFELGRTF